MKQKTMLALFCLALTTATYVRPRRRGLYDEKI